MTLQEIKLQSLRLMFADSDIQFSDAEYSAGTLASNPNTRDKLVRMNDCVSRAIDLYYHYVGDQSKSTSLQLYNTTVDDVTTHYNEISLTSTTDMGYPTRIDCFLYTIDEDDVLTLVKQQEQVNFVFDKPNNKIVFTDEDYKIYYEDYDNYELYFTVWYKVARTNLSLVVADSYDLDTLLIPAEVQRLIPYYVKGELYEEDEPTIAYQSKNTYVQFLLGLKKPFSRVGTKVKNPYRRGLL